MAFGEIHCHGRRHFRHICLPFLEGRPSQADPARVEGGTLRCVGEEINTDSHKTKAGGDVLNQRGMLGNSVLQCAAQKLKNVHSESHR